MCGTSTFYNLASAIHDCFVAGHQSVRLNPSSPTVDARGDARDVIYQAPVLSYDPEHISQYDRAHMVAASVHAFLEINNVEADGDYVYSAMLIRANELKD